MQGASEKQTESPGTRTWPHSFPRRAGGLGSPDVRTLLLLLVSLVPVCSRNSPRKIHGNGGALRVAAMKFTPGYKYTLCGERHAHTDVHTPRGAVGSSVLALGRPLAWGLDRGCHAGGAGDTSESYLRAWGVIFLSLSTELKHGRGGGPMKRNADTPEAEGDT